jgi:hypothetical protein
MDIDAMLNDDRLPTFAVPIAICAAAYIYLAVLLDVGSGRFWWFTATLLLCSLVFYRVAKRTVADQYLEEFQSEETPADLSLLSMPGCRVILTGEEKEASEQWRTDFRAAFERAVVPAKSMRCYCIEKKAVDVLNPKHCLFEVLFDLLRRNPVEPAAGILFVKLDMAADPRVYELRRVRAELLSQRNLGLMEVELEPIQGFRIAVRLLRRGPSSQQRTVNVTVYKQDQVWIKAKDHLISNTPENREYFQFDDDLNRVLQASNPAKALDSLSRISTQPSSPRHSRWPAMRLPWRKQAIPEIEHYPWEDLVRYLSDYSHDRNRLLDEVAALQQRIFDGPALAAIRASLEAELLPDATKEAA